jgi:hypothetical protein
LRKLPISNPSKASATVKSKSALKGNVLNSNTPYSVVRHFAGLNFC